MLIFNIFGATLKIENKLRRFCNLFYYYNNEFVQGWFYDLFLTSRKPVQCAGKYDMIIFYWIIIELIYQIVYY